MWAPDSTGSFKLTGPCVNKFWLYPKYKGEITWLKTKK